MTDESMFTSVWLRKVEASNVKFVNTNPIPVFESILIKHELTNEMVLIPRLRQGIDFSNLEGDMLFFRPTEINNYELLLSGPTFQLKSVIPEAEIFVTDGWDEYQNASLTNYLEVFMIMNIVVMDNLPFYETMALDENFYQDTINMVVKHLRKIAIENSVEDKEAQETLIMTILGAMFQYFELELPLDNLQIAFKQEMENLEVPRPTNLDIDNNFWTEQLGDLFTDNE